MARVEGDWITLDKYANLDNFTTVGAQLYPNTEADADHAYQKLKAAQAGFLVYRRAHVPAELHFNDNPREGDPVIVPAGAVSYPRSRARRRKARGFHANRRAWLQSI